MEELRGLDQVAYVRFASVYRQFQDVTEFEDEIRRLQRLSEIAANREQMSLLPELLTDTVGKGEVIVVNDRFGVRITEIISQADRIKNIG